LCCITSTAEVKEGGASGFLGQLAIRGEAKVLSDGVGQGLELGAVDVVSVKQLSEVRVVARQDAELDQAGLLGGGYNVVSVAVLLSVLDQVLKGHPGLGTEVVEEVGVKLTSLGKVVALGLGHGVVLLKVHHQAEDLGGALLLVLDKRNRGSSFGVLAPQLVGSTRRHHQRVKGELALVLGACLRAR